MRKKVSDPLTGDLEAEMTIQSESLGGIRTQFVELWTETRVVRVFGVGLVF